MKMFQDKVVLITGGTSGIGRATAIAFAQEGANVVVAGRREREGFEFVALIEQAGGKGLFLQTDVSVEGDVVSMVAKAVERFGGLDFAFNNAGVFLESGPITEVTEETIEHGALRYFVWVDLDRILDAVSVAFSGLGRWLRVN